MTEEKKTLLGQAIRSEIDSGEFYSAVANAVKNLLLVERMKFLANEEHKHEDFLRALYKKTFKEEPLVPDTTPVPTPKFVPGEKTRFSDLFTEAMQAEWDTSRFYLDLSKHFSGEEAKLLQYLSMMEMGHYQILETEREMALQFEDYENVNPLFHIGA